MTPSKPPRVRFAPSPTGNLHIGGARTALFNWLYARKHEGVFVVRVEDTDKERSLPEYEENILENLEWLGIDWDEGPQLTKNLELKTENELGKFGPYRQSERSEIYEKYAKKLIEEKHAYWCFCTKEEIEAMRQSQMTQGQPPKYSGRCRGVPTSEAEKRMSDGESAVLRFKMPEAKVSVNDMIRGKTVFDLSLSGDIVIARSLDDPLYNFAVVIDDSEMQITHVIRGEEHFSNTAKQVALIEALGFHVPHYAHMPLILNPDKTKMSKRFSDTAVSEYKKDGYLPEALFNFLALLGWHPSAEQSADENGEEREIFTKDELVKLFEIERVQKAGAVFNGQKLDWMNAQYIKSLSQKDLLVAIKNVSTIPDGLSESQIDRLLSFSMERMKKLTDFIELSDFFFELPDYEPKMLIWQDAPASVVAETLESVEKIISNVSDDSFNANRLLEVLSEISDRVGRGAVLWPLRVALSGKEASPGPFEIMDVLGKNETLSRIGVAIKKLGSIGGDLGL
ncbi:MAG: glutamate--tRNA ligase [Candidatus Harrisonbacteria bacterium CG10_big_fil_rev_8_21_14_0_10_40_38]|uniref:Glutamate--tRNA ligase n=1 Tax=Candidatus Harrisonbacteria bacterium CG10_big_fil_rev_8_21_14_0_10_40_38 TaxID=1974583 RepID=A0A2H0USK4_9BACT|nr:MAG: glutamate--tRNA ligase [Candidatus Harrisonbacteria bacterium CG10_big_fil_rev_8_21_14_0_10_40_38]